MGEMMVKKDYDLTEITRLLLKMRDACVRKAGDAYDDPERDSKYQALNDAIDLINNPSLLRHIVDAEPVRHGRWERMDEYCNHSKTFKCTVCKGVVEYAHFTRFCEYDYCPNCGAKMGEERSAAEWEI